MKKFSARNSPYLQNFLKKVQKSNIFYLHVDFKPEIQRPQIDNMVFPDSILRMTSQHPKYMILELTFGEYTWTEELLINNPSIQDQMLWNEFFEVQNKRSTLIYPKAQ